MKENISGPELVYGRWPVKEALEAGAVVKILFAQGIGGKPVDDIVTLAREKKVPYVWVDRRKLDGMAHGVHQGVVAHVTPLKFDGLETVWGAVGQTKTKGPSVLFLDGIMDPQNVGSILRSAVFFGVPAVVIPKWRSSPLTATVVKASAGAARLISIVQVSNLANALDEAKEKGIWLVGTDMQGEDSKSVDLPRPYGLVLGSEGQGLHHLIRKKCDIFVAIRGAPNRRGIDSLNVGVACAILLHQFC